MFCWGRKPMGTSLAPLVAGALSFLRGTPLWLSVVDMVAVGDGGVSDDEVIRWVSSLRTDTGESGALVGGAGRCRYARSVVNGNAGVGVSCLATSTALTRGICMCFMGRRAWYDGRGATPMYSVG